MPITTTNNVGRRNYGLLGSYEVGLTTIDIAASSAVNTKYGDDLNRDALYFGPVIRSGETVGVIGGVFDGIGAAVESASASRMAAAMLGVYASERGSSNAIRFLCPYFKKFSPRDAHIQTMMMKVDELGRTTNDVSLGDLSREFIRPVLVAYKALTEATTGKRSSCGTTSALQFHTENDTSLYFQGDAGNIWRRKGDYLWGGEHSLVALQQGLFPKQQELPLGLRDKLMFLPGRNRIFSSAGGFHPYTESLEAVTVAETDLIMSMTDGLEKIGSGNMKRMADELGDGVTVNNLAEKLMEAARLSGNTDDKTVLVAQRRVRSAPASKTLAAALRPTPKYVHSRNGSGVFTGMIANAGRVGGPRGVKPVGVSRPTDSGGYIGV